MNTEVFEASIQKGTNKLITTADNRHIVAPHGAFVKISSNEITFKIQNAETLNLKKKFVAESENVLKIKGNHEYKITPSDNATIYYDNYYASQITKIINGSDGLEVGEILYCRDGVATVSSDNLSGKVCELKVTATDDKGKATALSINEEGVYNTPPPNPVQAINEKEKIVEVEIDFEPLDATSLSERVFSRVDASPTETVITLSYPLPKGVKSGEIILSKQIINLDKDYAFPSVYQKTCSIISDFSPVNSFPLMAANNPSMHAVYNTAIEMIEDKLKKIEDRLKKLEKN